VMAAEVAIGSRFLLAHALSGRTLQCGERQNDRLGLCVNGDGESSKGTACKRESDGQHKRRHTAAEGAGPSLQQPSARGEALPLRAALVDFSVGASEDLAEIAPGVGTRSEAFDT